MSSGPFGDREKGDAVTEELSKYLAETGFTDAVSERLQELMSLNEPADPLRSILEAVGIILPKTDIGYLKAALAKEKVKLEEALEENARLKLRYEELQGMLSGVGDNCERKEGRKKRRNKSSNSKK